MSEKRHVVRDGDGWAVKKPGAERVSSRHDEHDDALERASEIVANAGGGSVVVHGDGGQIERVVKVERDEAGGGSSTASGGDRDGGSGSTPPRDDDGKFVATGDGSGGGGSSAPADTTASVPEGRAGKAADGSVSPGSRDTKAVVDKVGKGARTVASALGTAGKVGASAAVVAVSAASAAVEKKRKRSEAAEVERSRRAVPGGTSGGETSLGDGDRAAPVPSPTTARDAVDTGERSGVTAGEPAPRPARTVSTEQATAASGIGAEPDRHGVGTHGREGLSVDGAVTDVDDEIAARGSRPGRSDRAGLDAVGDGTAGSAGVEATPARRSRLLGSLFDRVREYLGDDNDRPRADFDRTRHTGTDAARRDDRRDVGDDV